MAGPARSRLLRLVFLALVVFLPALVASAQPAGSPDPTVAAVYRQLTVLRGIAAPGPPPPLVVRSREETRRFIEQELARRYSGAQLEAERKSMVAWGLIPADYDLRRLFLDLMEEQISAYYDPRGKVMVVGDWLTPVERQAALLHELVHAIQDREMNLDAFLAPIPGKGDHVLARQALIEGEAVGVMLDVIMRATGGDFAALPDVSAIRGQIQGGTLGPVVQRAPRFLRDLLLFPYVEGLAFVHQWRKRNPWSAASELYRDPPRSSAQILHPEQRIGARRDPVAIAIPALDALLPGHQQVVEDEMGEFGLGAVLGLALGEAEGRRAAVGWRGDRFRIWEDDQGRFVIAFRVAMESEPIANALALSLTSLVEKRHPALAGKGVPGAPAIVTWQDGPRAIVVEKRGTDVLLLERVPASSADRLREAVWRQRAGAP